MKWFSESWCAAAMEAVNANPDVYNGFEDAGEFTYVIELACGDKGLVTQLDWKGGVLQSWSPALRVADSDVDIRLLADLDAWREAAEGSVAGGTLVAQGRLKVVKGMLQVVISNGDALEAFLQTWGAVPTDWDV